MDVLEALKVVGPGILDPWYVVDGEDRIVDFNPAFHALFPRPVGRKLKGMGCRDVAVLPRCHGSEQCLRASCHASGPMRLDEVDAVIGSRPIRVVVSATPVRLADGGTGALIVLRDVTDEARIQAQYRELSEAARQEQKALQEAVEARTRDLLAANQTLNALEREIARLRRGGV